MFFVAEGWVSDLCDCSRSRDATGDRDAGELTEYLLGFTPEEEVLPVLPPNSGLRVANASTAFSSLEDPESPFAITIACSIIL